MENKIGKPSQVELTYVNEIPVSERVKVRMSKDAYDILLQCYNPKTIEHHIEVKALLMNRASEVLGVVEIGSGGTAESPIEIKSLLQAALLSNATSVILSRNSPSGNTATSLQDRSCVEHYKNACRMIEVTLHDYVIITNDKYYSFADEGFI